MELEKTVKHCGRYTVLNDRKDDTSIYKVTSRDLSGKGHDSITVYTAETRDYPLIYMGYDFGSLPWYGYGSTKEEAVLDLLRTLRDAVNRTAVKVRLPGENNDMQRKMSDMQKPLQEDKPPEPSEQVNTALVQG